MKNLFGVTLVLLLSMLVSCNKEHVAEYHCSSSQGQFVMLNYCEFSWTGNADGTITYDITSTVNEKSKKKGIRLLLDDKEIIVKNETELPYHGTIPVQDVGNHQFTFVVGIIPEISIDNTGVIENVEATASATLNIPFTVTFD